MEAKHYNIPVMDTLDDILDVFSNDAEIWNYLDKGHGRKIILFFNELDTLLSSRLNESATRSYCI
jgi:hypothetical protein